MTADYYIIEVDTEEGKKFFYRRSILVRFPEFAKQYISFQAAKTSIKRAGIKNFKIIKVIDGAYLYC